MFTHMRIAKPVANLERSFLMYSKGLGLHKIAEFNDHDGFNGIMIGAGFRMTTSFNPYWDANGRTFVDLDGYRVVIQNKAWVLPQ